MTLLMFRLREVPEAILASDKIAEMAKDVRAICIRSKKLEWLWQNDPRFSEILDPKRIKSAFVDKGAQARWRAELDGIILRATAKPPMGSIDGQEVGKSH
jgi:hypothetical protein